MNEVFETHDNKPGALEKNATNIAYWAANILIIVGEFRVYDFVYRATGEWMLALLATLTVGLPFLLWEILWKQRLANRSQQLLSFFMGLGTLLIAVSVGISDYVVAGVGGVSFAQAAQPYLLGVIAAMLSVHAVALLAYFLTDDIIRAIRQQAREEARTKLLAENLARATNLLAQKTEYMKAKQALRDLYGEDVDKQLQVLAGEALTYTAKEATAVNPTHPPTPRR